MELEQKTYLYLLILLPILAAIFLYNQIWKRKKQKEFGDLALIEKLSPEKSVFKTTLKFVIFLIALLGLIIALVNPKIGTKIENVKRDGIDIVFAVDVSKSMLCEDIAPNRMDKSKQLVSQIMSQLGDDRIGIIAYAGSSFPVLPITSDYSSAKMVLQSMNTDMLSSVGTSIGDAIKLAGTFFDKSNKTSKLLIIISDGEDHAEGADAAAEEAKKMGMKIITIGLGTSNGGPIPIKMNGQLSYKNDSEGNRVTTKLNQEMLTKIAKNAGGAYIEGKNTKQVVDFVKSELNTIQKTEHEGTQMINFQSQFQWFLGLAFLLLFLDIFLLERKTNWVTQLDLFNEKK
jgi:Ca-activated chloride channel homolog